MNNLNFVIDVAFVIATVAFFKQQVGLKGWYAIASAFAATLFVAFLPDIVALFPQSAFAVDKIVLIVKLFLSAPGLFDAIVDIGAKIKNASVG